MDKFLIPFLITLSFSLIFSWVVIFLGKKIKYLGRNEKRHFHKKKIVRIGGLAIVLSFNAGILFDKNLVLTPEIFGFLFASWIILAMGLWDDVKEIFWKFQLFFQIVAALSIFIAGIRMNFITNFFTGGTISLESEIGVVVSVFLVIFWIVLMINVMNWLDGIDGLSSNVALISAGTILFLSLKPEVNQPPVAIMSAVLAGAILGFLILNFYPAKIIAGTAGSNFLGFSLAVLAIFSGTKIATAILVMIVPLVDFLWVIMDRARRKKSIFQPDKNHLHFKLMELGWSPIKINGLFVLVTLVAAFLALNTRTIGKLLTIILSGLLVALFLLFIEYKLKNARKIKKISIG